MTLDIARLGQGVPSFPIQRRAQLGELERVRQAATERVGWTALLLRAYGQVCEEIPELQDIFVRFPVPYLYRHPEPVASITVHRAETEGAGRLIWGRIRSPHRQSLMELQGRIRHFQRDPLNEVFADGLRMERRPAVLRRLVWWLLMAWSGRKRAKHVGTFSISSLGGYGALNAHHPLVTSTSLAMGPIAPDGGCDLSMICDHRVVDGMLAAQALCRLEERLMEEVTSLLPRSERTWKAA